MAWEFLRDAERDDSYINIAINGLYRKLDSRDRPFVTELLFGSIRMRSLLDHIIDKLSDRPVDDPTRSVLRIAIYEALLMNTAEHAVVNEYVELSKQVIGKSRSGFVNALMRRVVRESDELLDFSKLDLATRTSHPEWVVDAYSSILKGDELVFELDSHNQASIPHIVSFEALDPVAAIKSDHTPFGYRSSKPPHEIDAIRADRAFVQDEGSQIVCEIALSTDPERSKRWLDLCAGPGGKFAYLAHFLAPGNLVGNELHDHRAKMVQARAPRHQVITGDGRSLTQPGRFDRILIDAPCTGIGALRRRPDLRWRRSEADLKELISIQRELLDSAAANVADDGMIFYITCSPHLMETKAQVRDFLIRHGNFQIVPITRTNLPEGSSGKFMRSIDDEGALQLLTYRDGTDAMFMAMLSKVARR
jgi:16S rRNA (cytosine967-C5)-methyltransferase